MKTTLTSSTKEVLPIVRLDSQPIGTGRPGPAFGGPAVAGIVHRVAAFLFISIFFGHFFYVMYHLIVEKRGKFRWFGPVSLIPNWKDFTDCWGMFKWFVGKGPRPALDRWSYFEKFDYWAVFWGVSIIGFSGLMPAFPHITAKFLPGWIFNVATLVHGEEAFLAVVFLFTAHFFNNHFARTSCRRRTSSCSPALSPWPNSAMTTRHTTTAWCRRASWRNIWWMRPRNRCA